MSLDPKQRFQTPSQLLDAIRAARRDLAEDKSVNHAPAPTTRCIFVAEANEGLQNKIREKLKELGFRVLLAADPLRALDRFRTQPFDAFILDAGTVGEDGLLVFERIMKDAERRELRCAGIVLLSEEQKPLAEKVPSRPTVAVLVRPVTMKELHRKLRDLVPGTK